MQENHPRDVRCLWVRVAEDDDPDEAEREEDEEEHYYEQEDVNLGALDDIEHESELAREPEVEQEPDRLEEDEHGHELLERAELVGPILEVGDKLGRLDERVVLDLLEIEYLLLVRKLELDPEDHDREGEDLPEDEEQVSRALLDVELERNQEPRQVLDCPDDELHEYLREIHALIRVQLQVQIDL